ncbi:Zn-dependent alcohol dehydrogenase [Mameliella sediminis]|uniref:Zn-dependent alcohol dehydrogenase n=1 Tax=Mameliella sediminis TaxID=2836866 RepID=UPI001C492B9F|nr:Zn-dependent alcohol dehydrogenase [Mameliella sediminis]MBV7395782.1 Zn-dependent alcohol dehydrogenase [Mameliella sediminis]MBY6115267.1 Zn-dependent alcohol dehydrogenase [Antarctobacter heliothermus]MBY6144668.1 Zn-dependent alcohol dehydrogenase [Mameliella alba]MCA0956076.1 Zn-dependent alcohol dehydrogenase [Mameliella alba]
MTSIRAAVCTAFDAPLQIEDLNLRAPGPGEIEVTLEAVAICHSDISYAEGAWGGTLPAVYGHEAAGRITALGDGVSGLNKGDRVVVTLIRACGTCPNCATGKPTICVGDRETAPVLTRADGTPVEQAMHCGAFAEKVVVDQSQAVALPDDMPPEAVCLLACGVITGIGAVINAGRMRPGEDVVVIGAGGVGLNAIQGARIGGARRIVAVDMSEEKLETARAFGATHGVLASDKAPWKTAMDALGRGADVVAVTVGAIPAYDTAMRYMGWGGRMVMIGMPHTGAMAQYEPVVPAFMGQHMIGSKMGDVVIQRDIPWMADLYRQGRLKLDELVSGRWRLDQINEAIADTKTGGARRNVILFDT